MANIVNSIRKYGFNIRTIYVVSKPNNLWKGQIKYIQKYQHKYIKRNYFDLKVPFDSYFGIRGFYAQVS